MASPVFRSVSRDEARRLGETVTEGRTIRNPRIIMLQIRMVAGFIEITETKESSVAEARYVPNTQFLSIPFRSELIHSAA